MVVQNDVLSRKIFLGSWIFKKLFTFQRYLNFCLDFFSHVGKRLDKKAMVNFRNYDVTN